MSVEGAGDAARRSGPAPAKRRPWRLLLRATVAGLVLGLLLVAIKRFVVDVVPVEGQSMWPTLESGVDHVLLNKLADDPRRWEIWAYEVDNRQRRLEWRIKRVVGLAGEHVAFRGGDLYCGEDRLALGRAARPRSIIDAMLIPVQPADPCPDQGAFNVWSGLLRKDGPALVLDAGAKPFDAALKGGPRQATSCIMDDHLFQDGVKRAGTRAVPDVRIDFVVSKPDQGGVLRIRHELRGDFRALEIDAAGIRLYSGARETEAQAGAWPLAEFPVGLRMETIDGVFRVALLGKEGRDEARELFRGERDTFRFGAYSAVHLNLNAGSARLERLDVRRDVYYVGLPGLEAANTDALWVPKGTIFVVGDNVDISEDSRDHGAVLRGSLRGRAASVVWPPRRTMRLP